MRSLSKSKTFTLRVTPDQLRRITRASQVASRRKGEVVGESTLFRDLGMQAIDQLLAESDTAAVGGQATA